MAAFRRGGMHSDAAEPYDLGFGKATLPKISRLERCPDRPLCRGLGQGNHFAGFSQVTAPGWAAKNGCFWVENVGVFSRFLLPRKTPDTVFVAEMGFVAEMTAYTGVDRMYRTQNKSRYLSCMYVQI